MHNDRPLTYGEGRVMKSPDFEIYHFYDSHSCNVRLHHHDFFELYYLRAGKMDYIVDGQRLTLHPGSLLFITPDQLHRPDIVGTSNFERFVLWINPAFMTDSLKSVPSLSDHFFSGTRISNLLIPDEPLRETLETLLFSLHRESETQQECRVLMCHAILIQLLIHIKRMLIRMPQADNASFAAHALPAAIQAEEDISNEQLHEVFSYIQDHLCEDLSISALAERFFFNPNTLARRFKMHAGLPIGKYVRKKRLAAARLYIYQGMSAIQAGTASGFTDYSTFYRAFRSTYGVNPKDFAASCHRHSASNSGA